MSTGYTDEVHQELVALVTSCIDAIVGTGNYRIDVVKAPTIVIITIFGVKPYIGRILGKGGHNAIALRKLCKAWWTRYNMRIEYTVTDEVPT